MSKRVAAQTGRSQQNTIAPFGGLMQRKCACGNHTMAGGECSDCGKKKGLLQRRASINEATGEAPPIVHEVLRSSGQPLDTVTRSFFESRFGHDFSHVRVHTDAQAAESARSVNALAYTVGSDMVFGMGRYAPHTVVGQQLIAHELAHTLQQAASGPAFMPASLQVNEPGDVYEREADRVAATIMSGDRLQSAKAITSSSPSIQRSLRVDAPQTPPTDPMKSPYIVFQDALAKVSGRIVTYVGDDLVMESWKLQQPTTLEGFIRRAMNSKRLYRLRLGKTDLGGRQVRGASWELQGADVVITVNQAHTGEFTWTVGELLAQQLASAVVQNDPEEIPSESRSTGTMEKMMTIPTVDYMLTARLPYGSTDSTKPEEIEKLQKKTRTEVQDYLNRSQHFRHLTLSQRSRAYNSAFRANGVTLLEIIHGVQTNTPYRVEERREGDRVFVIYEYPNRPIVASGGITTRHTTFVPGADATAQPILPGVAGQCNNQQKRADSNSCCTAPMMNEIKAHIETARAYTQRAIGRLETEAGTDCYLKRHFGAEGTPANRREIATQLRLALSELHLSRHAWKCREKGSGFLGCVKKDRGTVGGVTAARDVSILLCMNSAAPYNDWNSVLHEVVHRTGIFGEETYKGESAYPGKNTLRNADSYARLVEELGGQKWSPCKGK